MIKRSAVFFISLIFLFTFGCEKPGTKEGKEPGKKGEAAGESREEKKRREVDPNLKLSASHILIAYEGATRARPDITRTKEEAEELAREVEKEAKMEGADFAELAKKYSDCSTASRGGDLRVFLGGQMVKSFEDALMELEVGGVSGVVETPFGFHIIKRQAVEEIEAFHILVTYRGASRADQKITRTREEALERTEEILSKVKKGEDFAALAKEYSDCPSSKNGGNLGSFMRGKMVPAFEEAAFALEPGKTSEIVETKFGYHIIKRTK